MNNHTKEIDMTRHWETHLYTYAVALTQGDKIKPENLRGMRRKASKEREPWEVMAVQTDPLYFIHTGALSHVPATSLGGAG